jgi:ABC-type glycerol-3-phosphate transport system permease component
LIGMMVIYSAMSNAVARRNAVAVLVLLAISQLFWIAPALWIVEARGTGHAGSCALWLGNWLACGFSLVVFEKSAASIPKGLNNTAQMDGLSGFAAWRHVVLPFVGRDLVIAGIFTVMATLLPFWGTINLPETGNVITLFERSSTFAEHLTRMFAGSLIGAVPLIAIFFLARRRS